MSVAANAALDRAALTTAVRATNAATLVATGRTVDINAVRAFNAAFAVGPAREPERAAPAADTRNVPVADPRNPVFIVLRADSATVLLEPCGRALLIQGLIGKARPKIATAAALRSDV